MLLDQVLEVQRNSKQSESQVSSKLTRVEDWKFAGQVCLPPGDRAFRRCAGKICPINFSFVRRISAAGSRQQISEQEARQVVEKAVASFDNALRNKDVAKSAAIFTEDAVRVTPGGPIVGRPAIEKDLTETFKVYGHEGSKVNQVMVINE